jgi:hypothetical protein
MANFYMTKSREPWSPLSPRKIRACDGLVGRETADGRLPHLEDVRVSQSREESGHGGRHQVDKPAHESTMITGIKSMKD